MSGLGPSLAFPLGDWDWRRERAGGHGQGKPETMTRTLMGIARKALRLALIELLIPGGTLVVLVLLLTGGSVLPIPEKLATLVPLLKGFRRT